MAELNIVNQTKTIDVYYTMNAFKTNNVYYTMNVFKTNNVYYTMNTFSQLEIISLDLNNLLLLLNGVQEVIYQNIYAADPSR